MTVICGVCSSVLQDTGQRPIVITCPQCGSATLLSKLNHNIQPAMRAIAEFQSRPHGNEKEATMWLLEAIRSALDTQERRMLKIVNN